MSTLTRTFPETIPLAGAQLCCNCEQISASTGTCPVCGSHALMCVAAVVGGSAIEKQSREEKLRAAGHRRGSWRDLKFLRGLNVS